MKKIQRRLEFLILLSVFFPVLIDALYKQNIDAGKSVVLQWGIVVAALVLSYIIVEINWVKLPHRLLKLIQSLILLNISLFVPILLLLGYFKDGTVGPPYTSVVVASFSLLFWLPVIIFGLLLLGSVLTDIYREHQKDLRDGTYGRVWNFIKKA